jgi:hypothetical protein
LQAVALLVHASPFDGGVGGPGAGAFVVPHHQSTWPPLRGVISHTQHVAP